MPGIMPCFWAPSIDTVNAVFNFSWLSGTICFKSNLFNMASVAGKQTSPLARLDRKINGFRCDCRKLSRLHNQNHLHFRDLHRPQQSTIFPLAMSAMAAGIESDCSFSMPLLYISVAASPIANRISMVALAVFLLKYS